MTYRNGALRCDRMLCQATVAHWVEQLAWEDARAAGWHVRPCDCEWRGDYPGRAWRHEGDYCPAHFPQRPRSLETVKTPLL
jgi:hypothetical protein